MGLEWNERIRDNQAKEVDQTVWGLAPMNAVAADLERTLLELSESEKQQAFLLLARALYPREFTEGLTPIEVRNEDGRLVGYYVSFPEIDPADFPPLSPEAQAELARRNAEPGETIPMEEFFTFRAVSADAHSARKPYPRP